MKIAVMSVLGLTMMITPVWADEMAELKSMVQDLKNDYESRIKTLEARIEQLENTQDQKVAIMKEEIKEEIEAQAISADYVGRHNAPVGSGGLMVSGPGGSNVSLGGYVDMEYRDLNNAESTFRQHRWIINIAAQITDRVRFNSEYEIEYGGPNSSGGDGEAKVEQAYMDYLINDYINLRAGAVLAPFGRYNLYHDSDINDLTDRPLLARDIIPTTWVEAGYGLFGEFNPTIGDYEDLLLNYEVYVVNGLDDGFSDTGLGDARNSLKTDNNDSKSVVGRLVISPFLNHEIGLSGYYGKYNGEGDAITGGAIDMINTMGPFELISEYAYFDVEESPTLTSDVADFFQGAYVQLNYHFWPEFLSDTFLGRSFDDPTLTLISRYGWARIHDDLDATNGTNEEERTTLGINYRPIDNFVVKLEYQFNNTDNDALEAGDGDGFITSMALGF